MCSVASLKRRVYTAEYRVEAARLVIDTGRPIVAVAREIGVGAALLGRWVAKERDRGGGAGAAPLDLDERAELERLRKEVQDLRVDVAFLGKASAFFAAKSQFKSGSS
jgi:transposase